MNYFPGIRIQPDWDEAIRKMDKSFWFHLYEADQTAYQRVIMEDGLLSPDIDDISFEKLSPIAILVDDKRRRIQSVFQSADKILSSIHTNKQTLIQVNAFDINHTGDLGVSAASDGSVLVWETKNGEVRRALSGHLSEVYTCRFFPSGIVLLTGGADMQLKVWSAVTGQCAATLKPGNGGAAPGIGASKGAGGHRSGIVDTAFLERGRNIVAIDRSGWLRLWDVSTQIALSAIPISPNGAISSVSDFRPQPQCCTVKSCYLDLYHTFSLDSPHSISLESQSTQGVVVGATDRLVAVGTGSDGLLCAFDLAQSSRCCALKVSLPSKSGAVTACQFPQRAAGLDGAFHEFGLLIGGEDGTATVWDLRRTDRPLALISATQSGVVCLRHHYWRSDDIDSHSESLNGLLVALNDGRSTLHRLDPGLAAPESNPQTYTRILEFTRPDLDRVLNLVLTDEPKNGVGSPTLWTGTRFGHFYQYRKPLLCNL